MKVRSYLLSALFLFSLVPGEVFAAIDAKLIGKEYANGVVKIILFDQELVEKFKLSDKMGNLARGSGFFVLPEGVIFTNRHVIEWAVYGYVIADWIDEDQVEHKLEIITYTPGLESNPKIKKIYYAGHAVPLVQVYNGKEENDFEFYIAEIVSLSETYDGAILKIVSDLDGKPVKREFTTLPIGDSDEVVLGEDVVVLGFPSQYGQSDLSLDLRDTLTMSFGKESGWDYVFDEVNGLMKTVASIHEGNSGGPAFGEQNTVIGIATALGVQTGIGLIGSINGMYYVAEPVKDVFQKLVNLGLKPPKRKPSENRAILGKPQLFPQMTFEPIPAN